MQGFRPARVKLRGMENSEFFFEFKAIHRSFFLSTLALNGMIRRPNKKRRLAPPLIFCYSSAKRAESTALLNAEAAP